MVAAAAGLLGLASPALAADPQLIDISLDPGTINVGAQTTVRFKVQNGKDPDLITISVASNNPKVTCNGTCAWTNLSFAADETKDYSVRFRASGNFEQDEQATIAIQANGSQASQQLTINAPEQAQSVPQVSGEVANIFTAQPVEGATVYDRYLSEQLAIGAAADA